MEVRFELASPGAQRFVPPPRAAKYSLQEDAAKTCPFIGRAIEPQGGIQPERVRFQGSRPFWKANPFAGFLRRFGRVAAMRISLNPPAARRKKGAAAFDNTP